MTTTNQTSAVTPAHIVIWNDIDNGKSYATEANLLKALEKLHVDPRQCLIVCNRAGRFTAVFPLSNDRGPLVAHMGFKVLG